MWWSDEQKTITRVEPTDCFETSYKVARTIKEATYLNIITEAREAGYLITIDMGSRGLPNMAGFGSQPPHPGILKASHGLIPGSHQRFLQHFGAPGTAPAKHLLLCICFVFVISCTCVTLLSVVRAQLLLCSFEIQAFCPWFSLPSLCCTCMLTAQLRIVFVFCFINER